MSKDRPRVLIIHGPNLNLLGRRETDIYGLLSLAEIDRRLGEKADELGVDVEIVQTNHEGVMVETIQKAMQGYAGIIINPPP
jgi:3-dehydroquinate dehydratase-2